MATASKKVDIYSAHPTEVTATKYIELIHDEMSAYIKSNNALKNLTINEKMSIFGSLANTITNLMSAQSLPDEPIVSDLHDNQTITAMLENFNALLQSKEVSDQAKSIALKQLCCQGNHTPHFKVNQLARANITLAMDHAHYTGELQSQLSQSLSSAKIAFINRYTSEELNIDDLERILKEELGIPFETPIETSDSTGEVTRKTFTRTSAIIHLENSPKTLLRRNITSDQQEFLAYVRNRISPSETLKLLATKIKKDSETTDTLEKATLGCKTYSKPTLQPDTCLNLHPIQQPIAAAPLTVCQWSTESGKDVLFNQAHEDATSIRYPTSAKQLAMPAPYCFKASLSSSESITASTSSKKVFRALSEDQIHYCLAQNILARRAGFTEVIKLGGMSVPSSSKICSFANLYYGLAGPHSPSEPIPLTIESLQLIDLKSLPADVALAFLTAATKQVDSKESLIELFNINENKLKKCSKEVRDGFASALGNQLQDLKTAGKITLDDIKAIISESNTIHVIDFMVDACAYLTTRECELARVAAIHRMHDLSILKFSHGHKLNLNSNAISTFMLAQLSPVTVGIIFTKAEQVQRFHDYCTKKTFDISNTSEPLDQEDIDNAMLKLIITDESNCQAMLKWSKDVSETPLIKAVKSNNAAAVRFIRTYQKNHSVVTQPNSKGFYPLHYAAHDGNIIMLKLLVEFGENINQCRRGSAMKPLLSAIKEDKAEAVACILDMLTLVKDYLIYKSTDEMSYPLMHFAVTNGSVNVLVQLIQRDEDSKKLELKTTGKNQWTPYLTAVAFNQTVCMEVLNKRGADVKSEGKLDGKRCDALSLAAHFGHVTLIEKLMKEDETTEESQLRALFAAVDAGQSEALTCIIDCLPAKIKIPYHKGSKNVYSSKDAAKQNLIATTELIQGQKLTGVTPQISVTKINPPLAPLYAAVASGDIKKTRELLKTFTVNIPQQETDEEGSRHLLQVAIDSGHHELIPVLAAHPLVPKDIICVYRNSPLDLAKYPILFYVQTDISKHKVKTEYFKELVSHCKKSQIDTRHLMPKTSSTATDGMTALHFALISGRIAHAEVLIAAGANKKALVGDTFTTYFDYRRMTLQQIATKECKNLAGYLALMTLLNSK